MTHRGITKDIHHANGDDVRLNCCPIGDCIENVYSSRGECPVHGETVECGECDEWMQAGSTCERCDNYEPHDPCEVGFLERRGLL